uniref:Uncharacterized protein n=10 Tax=Triticinae TaxID=1648030 RepID=A0A453LL60_AEGTS
LTTNDFPFRFASPLTGGSHQPPHAVAAYGLQAHRRPFLASSSSMAASVRGVL